MYENLQIAWFLILMAVGCSIKIDKNYNYQKFISPANIQTDIEVLKENLEKKHFDIDWEGKKYEIFKDLDSIKHIDRTITLDSFENRLSSIINNIDDGHSKIIHQDSSQRKSQNPFGVIHISDSIMYLRIGNFLTTEHLTKTLDNFREKYTVKRTKTIIIDIRDNPGGNIQNVNRVLSHFIPYKTKIYEKVEVKSTSVLSILSSKLLAEKQNLRNFKYTSKKRINGSPMIYLWINEHIASGSMLLSYHLQKNGAIIVGQKPYGIFNTFGNSYGHRLPKSKFIYTLATARVLLTKENTLRMEDMITSNIETNSTWKIDDLITFINENEK